MPSITRDQVRVPADVSASARDLYIDNYLKATRNTGRLMLFACDQKIEHLNDDFSGEGIDAQDNQPEHLFKIGSQGVCGILAGQRGLIAQYAADYPKINYLVKLNSKTHMVKTSQEDPHLIAGAAGLACCIGADFVKVNPPKKSDDASSAERLKEACSAAGRTGLVCAGGSTVEADVFLTQLWEQIHVGGATGNATGRNIHQRSLDEAVRLTKAISAITLGDWSVADALAVFNGEKDFSL